jgi:hypothetical protein
MSCIDLITSCEGMNFQLAGFACYFRYMPSRKSLKSAIAPVSVQLIERKIYLIRGHKVMIDVDLAEMYDVPTYRLNEAVKRNRRRFPKDFMFRLTTIEAGALGSQFATSKKSRDVLTSQIAISKKGRGGRRTLPYAFTEQGVAMLSSVLNSERAIEVNIAIM